MEKQEKDEDHKSILEEVAGCFTKNYGTRVTNWNGDPEKFEGFHETLILEGFIDASLKHCNHAEICPESKHCLPRLVRKGTGRIREVIDLIDKIEKA